jgi:hypothetical protein
MFTTNAGTYGTDYIQRALVTAIGLGANRPQDAVYPTGEKDAKGDKFDADGHNYVMHFEKGQLPPVSGFWSLTMYDATYFFVPNPLNRYTVSSRDKLTTNPDGSVDIYIQAQLAARPQRKIYPDVAPLLAEGYTALDHRWLVEAAGDLSSDITPPININSSRRNKPRSGPGSGPRAASCPAPGRIRRGSRTEKRPGHQAAVCHPLPDKPPDPPTINLLR